MTAETVVPVSKRRRRGPTGGLSLKLDAEQRPGYVRRWVNGDPSRLLELQNLGYEFVTDAPGEGKARTHDAGTRISRHVGTNAKGEPLMAYLMETSEADYAIGTAEKEDQLKPFEQALRAGRDTTGTVENTYEQRDRSSITHS